MKKSSGSKVISSSNSLGLKGGAAGALSKGRGGSAKQTSGISSNPGGNGSDRKIGGGPSGQTNKGRGSSSPSRAGVSR